MSRKGLLVLGAVAAAGGATGVVANAVTASADGGAPGAAAAVERAADPFARAARSGDALPAALAPLARDRGIEPSQARREVAAGVTYYVTPDRAGGDGVCTIGPGGGGCVDGDGLRSEGLVGATVMCPSPTPAGDDVIVDGAVPPGASDVRAAYQDGSSEAVALSDNVFALVVSPKGRLPEAITWNLDGAAHRAVIPYPSDVRTNVCDPQRARAAAELDRLPAR